MVVMMMVRFHQHDRCPRTGVFKSDLIVVVFLIEYPRLFPNTFRIPLYSKSLTLPSKYFRLAARQRTNFERSKHSSTLKAASVPSLDTNTIRPESDYGFRNQCPGRPYIG